MQGRIAPPFVHDCACPQQTPCAPEHGAQAQIPGARCIGATSLNQQVGLVPVDGIVPNSQRLAEIRGAALELHPRVPVVPHHESRAARAHDAHSVKHEQGPAIVERGHAWVFAVAMSGRAQVQASSGSACTEMSRPSSAPRYSSSPIRSRQGNAPRAATSSRDSFLASRMAGTQGRCGPCPDRAMNEEADAPGAAVAAFPGQKHVEPRSARPEAVEQERKLQEALGMRVERSDQPEPHQPAESPSARVQDLEFVSGGKADEAAQLRIASREELTIWDVAIP